MRRHTALFLSSPSRVPLLSIIVMCSGALASWTSAWIEGSVSDAPSTRAVTAAQPNRRAHRARLQGNTTPAEKAACRGGNRLYRRQNGVPGYWRASDIQRVSVEQIPWEAVRTTDDLYAHNGNFYAKMRTDDGVRTVLVLVDTSGYRIRMPDGTYGPRIVSQHDGTWNFLSLREDYLPGTILANVVPEGITTHVPTLQQAARIMEVMGMPELTLAHFLLQEGPKAGSPLAYLAIAHAMIENLPARLRDRDAAVWSPRETLLVAPAIARLIGRPLSIEDHRGARFSFLADGREVNDVAPAGAVKLHWQNGRYRLGSDPATGTQTDYPSIFAAVEAATRPPTHRAVLPAEQEALFRTRLAEALETRSTQSELEAVLRHWTDNQPMPASERNRLKFVARLRHALFDRYHALTAAEEQRLLEATLSLIPRHQRVAIEVRQRDSHALLTRIDSYPPANGQIIIVADLDATGRRVAYYRLDAHGEAIRSRPARRSFSEIIDVILNGGDGQMSTRLGVSPWDWQVFADKLLVRIVDDEKALLPLESTPLAIRDEAILRHAKTQATDRWTANGRHYARLRNLDGRTQVVEIAAAAGMLGHEIIPPPHAAAHLTKTHIVWRDDKWYPHPPRAWHVTRATTADATATLPVLDADPDLYRMLP